MENLMFWNDVVVGGCLLGAGISLTVFFMKASKPTYTHNDIRNDLLRDKTPKQSRRLAKAQKKALKEATKRSKA